LCRLQSECSRSISGSGNPLEQRQVNAGRIGVGFEYDALLDATPFNPQGDELDKRI